MLKSTRFHSSAAAALETVSSAEGLEGEAVSSRRTRMEKTLANLSLEYVQRAIGDKRMPGFGVTLVDAKTMVVDGHKVTFQVTAEGLSLTVEGYDQRAEVLQGILDHVQKKLLNLDYVGRVLEHLANNPQVMGEPRITVDASGAVEIKVMATVVVDPQRQSQRAGVHAQYSRSVRGDLTTATPAAKSKKTLATVKG